MRFITLKFSHNSTLMDSEPTWSEVDRTKLPRSAHADHGDPDKKSTWKYPHHYIVGGGAVDDSGVFTEGTMYLHKGGLNAAWAAAMGARSGQTASQEVINHLKTHRKALGLDKEAGVDSLTMKADEEHQVVYGVVYAPNIVDTDWETMTADEVQDMAWRFLATQEPDNIDLQHNLKKSGCYVVESFLARPGDPDFPEGSWVLGVKCPDDIWEQVKNGTFNGFSLYGTVTKYPVTALLEVAKQITGFTESSTVDILPKHEHTFIVNVDNGGKIVSGKTDVVLGHSHLIRMFTATESELDHNHRIYMG